MSGAGKLTAILVLAFAAVCASTSPNPSKPPGAPPANVPCIDACSSEYPVDVVCVPTLDTSTQPAQCTAWLTCIETSCSCADKSKKCKKKKCKKYSVKKLYDCKKTCGLCDEPGSGEPDICDSLNDKNKCKLTEDKYDKGPHKWKKKCEKKKTQKKCAGSCCEVLRAYYASPSPSPSCDACCPEGTCDGPADAEKQACFDCAACNAEGTACPSS